MDSAIRRNFIAQLDKVYSELYKLSIDWEDLEPKDAEAICDKYPLQDSFDDWVYEFGAWVDSVKIKFNSADFNPTATVGELKRFLSRYTDDVQIVIQMPTHDVNIAHAYETEGDTTIVNLVPGSSFDTRQI